MSSSTLLSSEDGIGGSVDAQRLVEICRVNDLTARSNGNEMMHTGNERLMPEIVVRGVGRVDRVVEGRLVAKAEDFLLCGYL